MSQNEHEKKQKSQQGWQKGNTVSYESDQIGEDGSQVLFQFDQWGDGDGKAHVLRKFSHVKNVDYFCPGTFLVLCARGNN